jgi:hypothetical protein
MIVGIVGSEEAKFTPLGKQRARLLISSILANPKVTEVVSGGCHLGGIDIWAAEMGHALGLEVTEFKPKSLSWSGGYADRNLQIAERSDIVYCITVDRLPEDYSGMRFEKCYHCRTNTHVKSGGCWTMKQARRAGKIGKLYVIQNY